MSTRCLTLPSRGPTLARFACLRGPLMSNVRPHTVAPMQFVARFIVTLSATAMSHSPALSQPTGLRCNADGAFGLSFHAAAPKSRGMKESILSGAKVLYAEQTPLPDAFYDLAFAVSPKSATVWSIEAKLPVREGETWQQVSTRVREELVANSAIAFSSVSAASPPVLQIGSTEQVKATLAAASSYVLVTCFHIENERRNIQEGLAALSGK